TAATPEDIIAETAAATLSERSATRMDDRVSEAAMEERKKAGYF
ncbi:MAG: sulfate adenylyltransferase small subunit, partial [Neisseria zoodegmatis]|nr:sulfate adenylyltransferase small subunit [Neisseria zoodegmatis]